MIFYSYVKLPECKSSINSHENHHFPSFSHSFPMVFPWALDVPMDFPQHTFWMFPSARAPFGLISHANAWMTRIKVYTYRNYICMYVICMCICICIYIYNICMVFMDIYIHIYIYKYIYILYIVSSHQVIR